MNSHFGRTCVRVRSPMAAPFQGPPRLAPVISHQGSILGSVLFAGEDANEDLIDAGRPTPLVGRWTCLRAAARFRSLAAASLFITAGPLTCFALEVLWCDALRPPDLGWLSGCDVGIWLCTPAAFAVVACAIGPAVRRCNRSVATEEAALVTAFGILVALAIFKPIGHQVYQTWELRRAPVYEGPVGGMGTAARAGALRFWLPATASVDWHLVTEHALVSNRRTWFYCVAPLVDDRAVHDALVAEAKAQKTYVGLGVGKARPAAEVPAWAAYMGLQPCVDRQERTCSPGLFSSDCSTNSSAPRLSPAFKALVDGGLWRTDGTRFALSVGISATGHAHQRELYRTAASAPLPSSDGAPVVFVNVAVKSLEKLQIGNFAGFTTCWLFGLSLVVGAASAAPELTGCLALTLVAAAWLGEMTIFSETTILGRTLPAGIELS